MMYEMLDQLTAEKLLEQSFQVETFHSVKATNQWLLSQDNIKVVSLQIINTIDRGVGKLVPRRIMIAYQRTQESNDFYYGVSDGLEYCYDGDDEGSIEQMWNRKYPKLPYVMDREELCKGYRTYHRKYYVLYQVPHATDGCQDAVVNTKNIFRDKNDSGKALRRKQLIEAISLILGIIFTGIWLGSVNDYFATSQAVMQACKFLMFYFDATLGGIWIYQSLKYILRRRRR